MIGLGRVPPKFDIVFKSCDVSTPSWTEGRKQGGGEEEVSTDSHVCSSDQGIRNLSMESRDPDELNGTTSSQPYGHKYAVNRRTWKQTTTKSWQ
jgi:hypothetical protein